MASNSKNIAELLNGDVTVTATDIADGAVSTAKLADDAVTEAKWGGEQLGGRRNLIINGAMQVAQRGTTVSGISSSNTYKTVDRMFIRNSGAGTYTNSQSTDSPGYGFKRSIDFSCTTADSLSAADFAYLGYRFEGYDAVRTLKGETGAGDITLSFWVKSSETGTAVVGFSDGDNSRLRNAQYTINSADTWEKKTITISVIDGSNKFNNDNGTSLTLFWWIAAGSDRTSGSIQTTWATPVTANEAAGQTINAVSTTSSYIRFTGIQLEVGDTATPFEHRSYGEELAMCQRYCFQLDGEDYGAMGIKDSSLEVQFPFPTTMRAQPTVHWSGTHSDYTIRSGGTDYSATSFSQLGIRDYHYGWVRIHNASVGATGYVTGNADGFIRFDSEL